MMVTVTETQGSPDLKHLPADGHCAHVKGVCLRVSVSVPVCGIYVCMLARMWACTRTKGHVHVLKSVHSGAPNFIMAECSSYMKADGSIAPLDDAAKKAFMDKVDELSEQALRVLAIACVHVGKDLPFDAEDETDAKFGKLLKATCARTGKVLPKPYTLYPTPQSLNPVPARARPAAPLCLTLHVVKLLMCMHA